MGHNAMTSSSTCHWWHVHAVIGEMHEVSCREVIQGQPSKQAWNFTQYNGDVNDLLMKFDFWAVSIMNVFGELTRKRFLAIAA